MVFIRDPCGVACLIVTYGAVLYADYVVMRWIILTTMPVRWVSSPESFRLHLHSLASFTCSIWAPIHVVLFNTVVFLLAMSHLKAVFSDPGVVPLPANRLDFSDLHTTTNGSKNNPGNGHGSEWTVCTRCETYRPPRAHHCRICKRCIRRMDHHCPWINNCVGERNQKYFLQFLLYVGILSIYSVGLILGSWMSPCTECSQNVIESQLRM